MEMLFKVVLSAAVAVLGMMALRWIWTHQLDLPATISKASEKVVSPPDWVATRDPKRIYQDGNPVGDVNGTVDHQGSTMVFHQLANTSSFDASKPFEYQRTKLRVLRVNASIGMLSDGRQVLTGVLQGVECQVID